MSAPYFAVKGAAPAMHNTTVHASASLQANLLRRFVHGENVKCHVAFPVPTKHKGADVSLLQRKTLAQFKYGHLRNCAFDS